ncbi:MAG TPA: M15 family metallopeptidase [Candidatus Limnocylindria bacterium]|nr:M15 family metallopeptidase [Candidatus Limnocylindria bacterium]
MHRRLVLTAALAFGVGFLLGPGFLRSTPVAGSDQAASVSNSPRPTRVGVGSTTPVPTKPPLTAVDSCQRGSVPAPHSGYDEWPLTVLDAQRELGADYVPPDLVAASAANFDAEFRVRAFVIEPLRALDRAAAADGVRLLMTSAYRSYQEQSDTYKTLAAQLGPEDAARRAALPGHSEHQLGTAVDFAREGGAYEWLGAHASSYGFVASYAHGDDCYEYEPWHYRFVGVDLAVRIEASGLSLHDFLLHERD